MLFGNKNKLLLIYMEKDASGKSVTDLCIKYEETPGYKYIENMEMKYEF